MCAFTAAAPAEAGASPDRVDALVWALWELLVERLPGAGMFEAYRRLAAEVAG